MSVTVRVKRRVSGASGAPSSLKTGELAYNMVDGLFYVGFGDDGSGNATSIKTFAQDNYTAPAAYTASGNGIELSGNEFALNYTEVATGISLSNYAPLASPALTGNPTAPTQSAGNNTTRLATTAFVKGELDALLNGASSAYDTLKELQDLIVADESTASALATTVSGKLAIASNLSDLNSASTARTNLGLGNMATQAKSAVDITGGTIAGVTLSTTTIDGGTF
jgi:hypothetical protein